MARALDDKSSAASDLERELARLQAAEQQLGACRVELAQYGAGAAAVAQAAVEAAPQLRSLLAALEVEQQGETMERLGMMLGAAIRPALGALDSFGSSAGGGGLAGLGTILLQLCSGLGHVVEAIQERSKVC